MKILKHVLMEGEPGAGGGGGNPPADPPPSDPPPSDPPPSDPPALFCDTLPEQWRGDMVKSMGLEDDVLIDKRVKQLERVPDFKTLTQNYFESQDKIREGIKPQGLATDATDEQIAEYREANNIPAEAADYSKGRDDGLILNEVDERMLAPIYGVLHKHNISAEAATDIEKTYFDTVQVEQDAQLAQDGLDQQTFERQAKDQWGADYVTNINMAKSWVNMLPESIRDEVANARLPSGKALFNSPEFMTQIVENARKLNPAGTVVPNSNNPTQAISDEIKKIEGMMGTDEYDKDPKMQERLRNLYDADENMKK